ncbi:META domain-containing protein [Paracoccus aerodenitrificans]|uniref:META domain-containing protein n=1 Tax=Paracoccus aerodenitrificans TaxID=3017781 RepID=UPI0022F0C1E5|nr:META domain-containing protein [Paracoccus aerodenitrificans]WBU64366.1 META domain-containing protein [Paracoccus aerodenitrificans]
MFRQLTAAALATMALAACEPTPTTPDEPYSNIPTGDYVLFNIGGEVLSVRHTTMTIAPTMISGRTGCNSFVAPISGTPPEIVVGPIQTAGQSCRWSAQESSFFNGLRAANRITYEDGVLRIAGGQDTLTFEYGHLASAEGVIGRNLNPNPGVSSASAASTVSSSGTAAVSPVESAVQ